MNLRDLEYFIAVVETGHFGRAAEMCHVSQPTLSTQIRKLEDELGTPLLERTSRRVVLTSVGREVAKQARQVLAQVGQLKAAASAVQGLLTGPLRLGAFPTLGPYLLPELIPLLREHAPDLKPYLIEEKTTELLTRLRDGRLDAALLALPIEGDDLKIMPLFREPFVAALPHDHALARKRQLDISALADQNLLLLEDGHCFREQALEICHRAGAGEEEFKATSLETLRHMVSAGMGITLMPALAARDNTAPLALRPFKAPAPERTIGLVWRRGSAGTPTLEALAQLIRRHLRLNELVMI